MTVRIDGYPIDLAVTEEHKLEADVTTYPVEKGADIADHVRSKPAEVTLEGVVSDTPMGAIALDQSRVALADVKALPSLDAFQRLKALQASPKLVTVETSLGKYESMVLTSLVVPRAKDTTKGLKFTVTFTQITLVENTRTTVRVAVPNAGGKKNLGNKESKKWGQDFGIKDAIFVISIPISQSATYAKTFGPPLHRRHGSKEYDCFQVQGDTKPDGYLTANSSKVSTDKYTYHEFNVSGGSETRVGTFVGDTPVHFDYADGTWRDDRDNHVVKQVPMKPAPGNPAFQRPDLDQRWKGITVVDPKGHRQTF